MKQRIRVTAIIKNDDGAVLLLQRASGRQEDKNEFELPTGKIDLGEQPEEALSRMVHDFIGARIKHLHILDVVTFSNLRDSSEISNLYIIYSVTSESYKISINRDRHESYRWATMSDIHTLNIDGASCTILEIINNKETEDGIVKTVVTAEGNADASVYTDGGSRGNPGLSAIGYYILNPEGSVLARGGEFIGITSSRQAEYIALKTGIEKALSLGLKSVKFYLDNLMIVNQMNNVYQVKNRDLWPLYDEVKKLLKGFDHYSFTHIKRDRNFEADSEVNHALDQHIAGSDIF